MAENLPLSDARFIPMLCPVCKIDLVITERKNVEIDYCPKCRGVWLDRGEIDKIIERTNAQMDVYTEPPLVQSQLKRKNDFPDGELPYDYDDDDYKDRRHEGSDRRDDERNPRQRRKSFLDDVFDIFD
jgi:Zn-finger nucleic acid-binding protein